MSRTILTGFIASLVIVMFRMLFQSFAGNGLWSPVVYIAATVMGDPQNVPIPVPFFPIPVVAGLMGS